MNQSQVKSSVTYGQQKRKVNIQRQNASTKSQRERTSNNQQDLAPYQQKNILGKLPDQKVQQVSSSSQISQRIGKVQSRDSLRAQLCPIDPEKVNNASSNFSAALVSLLQGQNNIDKFSVTFSGQQVSNGQSNSGLNKTLATYVNQSQLNNNAAQTIPADQLAINIKSSFRDGGKHQNKNQKAKVTQSGRVHLIDDGNQMVYVYDQYGTQPGDRALNSLDEHLLAPKLKPQQVQRHQSVQNSTKLSQQLNKVSYGRKNSSNSRGYQNNKEEGNNSLAPIFDGSSSFNKPQGRSNFNGRIIIQRGTGRHQNSSKSFILEEQKNHFENGTQLYLGPSHPTQNVQFNNYSAKGPTEAYTTQNQTVQTPSQQVPVMLDDQRVRIVKKPPTQRQKRKSIQNSDAESQEIIQVKDQLKTQFNKLYDVKNQKTIQSNTVSQNNQNVNSDNQAISQTRDQPPVIIDDQIPSRLESLIKQLIIRKQVSVSPNFQLKRPNGQNYFDQSSFLTNELTNLAHQSLQHPLQHPLKNNDQQKDVLSTFTTMTQNDETVKVEANTINNSFQDQFNMIGVQPEKSVENTGSIKGKQSEWFQQSSPKHKINVTSGEHGLDNLSKDLGMESLINYQELFNSKDILGSSLPISHTLHLALSNALKETNQNYLRNTSNVDQRSLALTNSPERQLSVQEKQDISKIFYNNLNKAQQNFISLDLQPKSVDSAEEIYEQTLNAFQQDINSLHEIEQSRQEISTRIREHQRILNRLHNVQQQNRGSLLVQNQNARQVSQPLQQTLQSIGINQKGSVELPPSNMSQIDFALMNRAQQNSVQPTLYDQRSFVSTQMQQHYALQNETQYQSYNSPQVVNIARGSVGGDKQNLASSPKVGRYRLKGMQGALNYPQQANHQVYSNRVQFPNETKRNKSVRQRGSRHIIPLASTSVGGSNLRSGGRKYITTQQNSSTKGYGTIDNHSTFQPLQNKKTQTGYLAMGSALTTIDQGKQMHQQHLGTNYSNKIKSTTIVYGPTGYSSIGSNSNGRASVPKQRQQLSNLRPAFQSNINKAGRSFSNRNRVLQQSLVNNNTSVKIARNTYASICSGSQTSQTYHYGNQTSSIDPKQTNKNSTNALETLNDDRSISPHPTKSRRIVKKNAVAQHRDAIPIRKGYKKSTSRVRGEVVAASSIVAGIRKHSKINTQQNVLPKAAQMSQQQVTIRDSLQETNPNSSILIAINKPSSTCMSPFEKEQQTFDSRMSPEKIRIVQLQQKLQLSESNGVRQVRIRGMQTRNHFSNDTGGRNDEVFHTHEMSGQDFRVGGQVIIIGATNGPTNVQKDSHNLRYSRATYDFQNNSYEELPQIDVKNLNQEQEKSHLSMIDKQSRIESMQKIDQNHKKQPTHTEEKRRKDVIMKLINEDNPFENPPQIIRSPVAQLQEQVSAFNAQSQYAHADKSLASKTTGASSAAANAYKQSRGRFTGNSGGRISLLAAGAMRRSETTEDSQQCKYMDATMQMTSLPMPMQSINHQIIAEEEAAAEQDEKSTNKESSTQHGKPASNNRGQENSSSTPNQSDPTIKYTPPSVGSVEDECLIGDDSSNHFEKEEDEKSIQPLKSFTDLDINKPIQQNFNRVMSRDSIKFATRNQKSYQSQTSIRVFTAKEQVYVDQSNIFGVNLLEQQKKRQFEQSEQQSARSMLSESDGNIICESVNRGGETQIEESGGMADVEMESGCDDQTPDIFLKKSIKPMHLNFEKTLQDFPPLLQTTMTNIASNFSQRSPKSNHSDDEVEVRRALEESENAMRNDIEKQPQLHRQSTHSLLNKTKEQKEADIESVQISLDKKVDNSLDREIICTTPADLLVILGQHQRSVKPKRGLGETMEIFNDNVVHDVIDENSNDEYSRKPPKNNNFMGRPMTAQKNKNQIQI